jgi:hypothetical protein
MPTTRDWQRNRAMWLRVLERQTGAGLEVWHERIRKRSFAEAHALRAWLSKQHVTGYAQSLLVMERLGYPDFVTATAEQLIHETMRLQIVLTAPGDVDVEVQDWLRQAYDENS